MSRPKKNAGELSAASILGRMTPGIIYNVPKISGWYQVATTEVRPLLMNLLDQGLISKQRCPDNSFGYARPKAQVVLDTSVAAPPQPPDLTRNLVGYEVEIRTRVALCMMARSR